MLFAGFGFVFADKRGDVAVGVDFIEDVCQGVVGCVVGVELGNDALFAVHEVWSYLVVGEFGPGVGS